MKKWFRANPALYSSILGAISLATFAIANAQDGDAARGKELYYDHGCYGCHGYNGETGARDLVGTNTGWKALRAWTGRSSMDWSPMTAPSRW